MHINTTSDGIKYIARVQFFIEIGRNIYSIMLIEFENIVILMHLINEYLLFRKIISIIFLFQNLIFKNFIYIFINLNETIIN